MIELILDLTNYFAYPGPGILLQPLHESQNLRTWVIKYLNAWKLKVLDFNFWLQKICRSCPLLKPHLMITRLITCDSMDSSRQQSDHSQWPQSIQHKSEVVCCKNLQMHNLWLSSYFMTNISAYIALLLPRRIVLPIKQAWWCQRTKSGNSVHCMVLLIEAQTAFIATNSRSLFDCPVLNNTEVFVVLICQIHALRAW